MAYHGFYNVFILVMPSQAILIIQIEDNLFPHIVSVVFWLVARD